MHRFPATFCTLILATAALASEGSRLVALQVADSEILHLHCVDSEVVFVDDASGHTAYDGHEHEPHLNHVVHYGHLDTTLTAETNRWTITSPDDPAYQGSGQKPQAVYRKTRFNGHAQLEWGGGDHVYENAHEHHLYLHLPQAMRAGRTYTVEPDPALGIDRASASLTFDIDRSPSESIKVNLVGYASGTELKAADLYLWLGDGGPRDYSAFVGNAVHLVDQDDGSRHQVGTVAFWHAQGPDVGGRDLTGSDVWRVDLSGFERAGTYRLVVNGVGCSRDFTISSNPYRTPFQVSTLGFFYMRIGVDGLDLVPVPRRPLWIPGQDPSPGFRVVKTTLHPYRQEWRDRSGDKWDQPDFFAEFIQPGAPENPNAWGGHSDALDWDRHLGHVSIVYDLLLPYLVTGGDIDDDDLGLPESGNGLPDVIDSARYEVDFWLRLRDGAGYAHGLSNPNHDRTVIYQAAATAIAAWANAANAAMLAEALDIAGHGDLSATYRQAALSAWDHAAGLADPMLDATVEIGDGTMTGRCLRITAAAHLYNLTGEIRFEEVVAADSRATSDSAVLADKDAFNQLYATAAYLVSRRPIHHPELQARMRSTVLHQAHRQEADLWRNRPSRRTTDNATGWFPTIQNLHRTIIAHATTADPGEQTALRNALTLEADWGLGRNPLNHIQMTTATTVLAGKRSVEAAYTSGRNDGTPGLHPGHTPFLNMGYWYWTVGGNPSVLGRECYPTWQDTNTWQVLWPAGELAFPTRYCYAHSEFTPQQTMRGKQALYAYLHALGKRDEAVAGRLVTLRDVPGFIWQTSPAATAANRSGMTHFGPLERGTAWSFFLEADWRQRPGNN